MANGQPLEPIAIEKSRLIMVEGPVDRAFFTSLIDDMSYSDEIQVIVANGKDNIRDKVQMTTIAPGFNDVVAFGLTRDMDTVKDNAFIKLQDAMKAANLSLPQKTVELMGDAPAVGMFLFPDEDTEGELEDLCLRAFEDDDLMTCADSYFRCLDRLDQYVSDGKYAKAKLQVLLTAMGDGELTLRQAVNKSWWRDKWNHPAFNDVRRFVELIATA